MLARSKSVTLFLCVLEISRFDRLLKAKGREREREREMY